MMEKLRWIGTVVVAALMALAAFLYGRRTPRVERAEARSKAARVRVLEVELEAARQDAAAADASSKASAHMERANTIERKLQIVRAETQEALSASPSDDDDLAVLDNRRRRSNSAA